MTTAENTPEPRNGMTICDQCGRPEEASELQSLRLRGEPALACLRCIADIWPWVTPSHAH